MKNRKLTRAGILSLTLLQFVLPAKGLAVNTQDQGKANQSMTRSNIRQSPLACNATALDARQRERIRVLLNKFHADHSEVRELSNGYSVRLSGDGSTIRDVAEYITLERLCCPFFDFALQARRESGPVWLTLTGRQGVKEFARIEFQLQQGSTSNALPASENQSPLACNDGALTAAQRKLLVGLLKEFRAAKQEIREFADGYAIQLPVSAGMIRDIADYMSIVRICSPYFETTLQIECEGGPVWLELRGREGVKELVKSELGVL